jgi:mycothiol synthase
MISSPPDFTLRPVQPADAEAVLELIDALQERLGTGIDFTLEDIRSEWRHVDVERDLWAWDRDDRLAAFAIVRNRAGELSVNGFVHPDFRGRGLGTTILRVTEARARERGARKLGNAILAPDRAAAALLQAHGYRDVRHYFQMTIEMDEPPPEPHWPKGLEPRPLELEHARAFHAADEEAFADERGYQSQPFEEFRERWIESPRCDPALWTAVWDGDQIAATLIADRKRFGAGWVASLGVRRPWRRRGLGLALLLRSFGQLYERGERRVSLSVDTENPTGATRLYERAGMRAEHEEVLYEKELGR